MLDRESLLKKIEETEKVKKQVEATYLQLIGKIAGLKELLEDSEKDISKEDK